MLQGVGTDPFTGYDTRVNKGNHMKSTQRPTPSDIQREVARQARRQAALDRRQDDYRKDEGYVRMYS